MIASLPIAAAAAPAAPASLLDPKSSGPQPELREAFDRFVGNLFYGQMLKSLRETQQEPAYFHGGQAEEIFRDQLDQVLAEEMTQASAQQFTGPLFELFSLQRK